MLYFFPLFVNFWSLFYYFFRFYFLVNVNVCALLESCKEKETEKVNSYSFTVGAKFPHTSFSFITLLLVKKNDPS